MLEELYIENLAVIEKARLNFGSGFHVFTGETGAGKSILIGSIQAVLGGRVTRDLVRSGCERAQVTALFTGLPAPAGERLRELGIECEDDEVTLTREIRADGGSISRINGKTAAVSALREVGVYLLSIHGQHDNQALLAPERHLGILDDFGGDSSYLEQYQRTFRELQQTARELGKLRKEEQQRRQREAILKRQVEEIGALSLREGEEDELENALMQAENAEQILAAADGVSEMIHGERGVAERLESGIMRLHEIEEVFPVGELAERLRGTVIELRDIAEELTRMAETVSVDEERADRLRGRYQAIEALKKEFFCDYDELLKRYRDAKEEMTSMQSDSERIQALEAKKAALLAQVTEEAKALSSYRAAAGERFADAVAKELTSLDMPDVVLKVEQTLGKLTIQGRDSVTFLISANKGEAPRPLAKIASGGELSRIMLALKSVLADRDSIPTLIFDEIDTGVSGRAAQKIGGKLSRLSRGRQVLCVTHLSQIAVLADRHFMIEKHEENGRTVTQVHTLDFEGRVGEIARIMGGEAPSELMRQNAREELRAAEERKKSDSEERN